jgi:hypothetical protein
LPPGGSIAVGAQRQEQRHLALDMRLEADLLLERHLGDRLEALRRLFLLLAKIFFDRMAHRFRFAHGLGLGLDPKPGFAVGGVADVLHASSGPTIGIAKDWRHRERLAAVKQSPDAAPCQHLKEAWRLRRRICNSPLFFRCKLQKPPWLSNCKYS